MIQGKLLNDNADIVECGDEDSEDKLDDLDVPDDVCPLMKMMKKKLLFLLLIFAN